MSKKRTYFELERHDKRVRVIFTEENLASRDEMDVLFKQLGEILNMTPKADVQLDFRNVRHIASVFLGKLMGYHKRIKDDGGSLRLVNVNPNVQEVFILTRISEQISIDTVPLPDAEPAAKAGTLPIVLLAAGGVIALVVIVWLIVR